MRETIDASTARQDVLDFQRVPKKWMTAAKTVYSRNKLNTTQVPNVLPKLQTTISTIHPVNRWVNEAAMYLATTQDDHQPLHSMGGGDHAEIRPWQC